MKFVSLLAFFGAALLALACESAVDLDVAYKPGASADGGLVRPEVDGSLSTGDTPLSGNGELQACPCDQSQGLGCCISNAGPAFCTADERRCRGEQGALYKCFGPDVSSESVCCWNGSGAGARTALAGDCKERPVVCSSDSDCAGGVSCKKHTCKGVEIGACGVEPPACPPST